LFQNKPKKTEKKKKNEEKKEEKKGKTLNFLWPLFCHFLVKAAKIRPQILSANFFFLRPFLSFLAGISATWQHCSSIETPKFSVSV
jgi:hypothetical protein